MAGDGNLGNNLSTSPISQAKGPDDYDEDPNNDPNNDPEINKFLWPWSHPPPDQPGYRLDWLVEALMEAGGIIPLAAVAAAWFGFAEWIIHRSGRVDRCYQFAIGWIGGVCTIGFAPPTIPWAIYGIVMTTGRFLLGIALVVYGIYVLCISPFCSPAPFRRQECNTELGNCKLCTQCQQIVADPLLSGSNWPLVRSSRKYPFYSIGPLRSSAESCHLCSLLLRSLHRSSRLDVSHPTYDLTVVVFKRSFYFRKSVLEIQLQTPRGSEETSKRLRVEWSPKSSHTHRCATSSRTDSEDIAQLANGVIQQCIQHHTLCKREFVDKESRGIPSLETCGCSRL